MPFHRYLKVLLTIVVVLGVIHFSQADQWDPNDDSAATTTNVLIPTLELQTQALHELTSIISGGDSKDWFKFSLTAGTTYLFEAIGGDDTEGELYDPGLSSVAFNGDGGESGFNFLIAYTPVVSGYHYLKVTEWSGVNADYDLNYKIARDEWDPADDVGIGATARTIDEYNLVEGPHTLTETDTNDWYIFSLNAGNTYRFTTMGVWNTFGSLFRDAAGTIEVASDDNGGDSLNFEIDYTPSISEDYYLRVSQIIKTQTVDFPYANYSLSYTLIEDEWDPGDDSGIGATVLSPIDETLRTHGLHALNASDTNDWFAVYLTAGETYRFESTGDSDPEAFLYSDMAGTIGIVTNNDFEPVDVSDNFQIIYTPETSANYYLRVSHSNPGKAAVYQLTYGIENDLDGDGMADSWEIDYFGSTNELPNVSWDTDTQNNLAEFIAGTDPTNSASYFKVSNTVSDIFVLQWTSVAGREYQVYWTESLTNSFLPTGPVHQYPKSNYTDHAHSTDAAGFYKVEVQLQ